MTSYSTQPGKISITESIFGLMSNGEKVFKYTLKNKNNFEIDVLSYGAALKSAIVTDKFNKRLNLVLNFDKLSGKTFKVFQKWNIFDLFFLILSNSNRIHK